MGGTLSAQAGIFNTHALAPAVTYNTQAGLESGGVLKGEQEQKGDVVIVPVDGSQQAEIAFEWYVQHVHRPQNLVHIIHCLEVEPHPPSIRGHVVDSHTWQDRVETAKTRAEELVQKFENKLHQYHVKGDVIAEVGHPGHIVVEAADKCHADMIIMGSRGHGIVRRTILGSVSNYVVHHTQIPVTVVPKETLLKFF